MVRELISPRGRGWKAGLAVAVVAGALLWHVLACTESPMAFSPNGEDLAFVLPGGGSGPDQGKGAFRLAVLSRTKGLRTVETSADAMLLAPAYSPDGTRLCYLRVPVVSDDARTEAGKISATRKKLLAPELPDFPEPLVLRLSVPPRPGEPAASPAPQTEDASLPPLEKTHEMVSALQAGYSLGAMLVVRDAKTDAVLSLTPVPLPVGEEDKPGTEIVAYYFSQPQYGGGGWIYLCMGTVLVGVNPETHASRLMAAPVQTAVLSRDGKTLAALMAGEVCFIQTDGEIAVHRKWTSEISLSGLAWGGSDTLALLQKPEKDQAILHLLRSDGKILRTVTLDLSDIKPRTQENTGELAVAPDGKHFVVCYGSDVLFLDSTGKVLKRWHHEVEELAQPTFAPDGQRVAFKVCVKKEGDSGNGIVTVSIVFFSPTGEELSRTPVPPPAPPAGAREPPLKEAAPSKETTPPKEAAPPKAK